MDATLHRDFTLYVCDEGGPIALEALRIVVRTITVPLEVKRKQECLQVGLNIFYSPSTKAERETVRRIGSINCTLRQQCQAYLRIPRARLYHFILGQYFDYVTRRATRLLQDGTDEGTCSLRYKHRATDTGSFLVTSIKLVFGWLRGRRSHRIDLQCFSHKDFEYASFFDVRDRACIPREHFHYLPVLLQPAEVRDWLDTAYADQPLRDLEVGQRAFYPQPNEELRLVTFAMITHARLGKDSVFGGLPGHVVEAITFIIWAELFSMPWTF